MTEEEGELDKVSFLKVSAYLFLISLLIYLAIFYATAITYSGDPINISSVILILLSTSLFVSSFYGVGKGFIATGLIVALNIFMIFTLGEEELGLVEALPLIIIICIIAVPVVFWLGKGYNKLRENSNKSTQYIILIVPLVILIGITILGYSTCSFNHNGVCVALKLVVSGEGDKCAHVKGHDSDYCYEHFAELTGNLTWCTNINHGSKTKLLCFIKSVEKLNNEGLTENICEGSSEEIKAYCFYGFAIAKKDSSLCAKIGTDEYDKENCLVTIAISQNDPATCNEIASQVERDTCYFAIVRNTKDRAICDKISEGYYNKGACLELASR